MQLITDPGSSQLYKRQDHGTHDILPGPYQVGRAFLTPSHAHLPLQREAVKHFADTSRYDRRAFGRQANPTRSNQNPNQAPSRSNTSSPTTYSPSSLGPPQMSGAPLSPSLSASMAHNESAHQTNQIPPGKTPLFFREEHAGFIARGNFATLALKPQLVEEGEWLAHQGTFHVSARYLRTILT